MIEEIIKGKTLDSDSLHVLVKGGGLFYTSINSYY